MCVNGPWFEPFLTETRLRDSYYVATIPSGPRGRATRVTWDGLCIAGHLSETEKRRAWQFVRFCVSKPAQDMIAETGRALPALVSSMPAFDRAATDSRRRKFVEALAYARLQPRTPNFTAIDRAVQRRLQRFISDDSTLTPAQFLSDLRREPAIVQTYIVDGDRRR